MSAAPTSTKYIFVTGGVVSSLGKGIAAASLGRLLVERGLTVTMQKFDPYINVDPGTMSPFQHGEVFVTDDGAETDLAGRALWFSRAAIPFRRDADVATEGLYWQHVGLYVYTRSALARWVTLPPTAAEQAEKLEQLRALEHGMHIGVARLTGAVAPGIDTAEDLTRAQAHWRNLRGVKR